MNFNDLLIKERIDPRPVLVLRHRPHEPEWDLPLAKQAKRIKQKNRQKESNKKSALQSHIGKVTGLGAVKNTAILKRLLDFINYLFRDSK